MFGGVKTIRFDQIELGPNPRTDFGDLSQLIGNLKARGLINPITVRVVESHGRGFKLPDGKPLKDNHGEIVLRRYILDAGGRRYEAIRQIRQEAMENGVKDKDLPFNEVVIRTDSSNADDAMWTSIGENLGRKDLNPMELANALGERLKVHSMEEVLHETGLKKPWVDKVMELKAQLSEPIQKAIARSDMSMPIALKLVGLPDEEQQVILTLYTTTKAAAGKRKANEKVRQHVGETHMLSRKKLSVAVEAVSTYFDPDNDPYWRGAFDAYRNALGMPSAISDKIAAKLQENKDTKGK